jgi:hypothetical protein
MTACIESVIVFGSELWWKDDRVKGNIGRAEELQKEVNTQARAVTGCFQTTNQGALAMESGSDRQRHNWKTGNGASAYGYSACQMATRLERWLGHGLVLGEG